MHKRLLEIAILLSIHGAFLVQAQTLDELNRPLLKKGQWDLVLDYKNFGREYWGISLDHEETSSIDSQVILFPRLAFGLAKNLQLTIDGAWQFPITNAMPQFETWDYWRETNTLCLLSAQLRFRPARNLELGFFWLTGQAKEDVHYARTVGVDDHIKAVFSGDILILSGTWLSSVDSRSRLLRADLDGLHRPLLKKGHWRIDPEILIRRHEYHYHSRLDVLPDFIDKNSDSTDVRLRLAASHGLTDHLQAKADIYWQPSSRTRESSRSLITWWDGTEHADETETCRLLFGNWGARGSLAWRPSRPLELSLAIRRNRLKIGYEETNVPFGPDAVIEGGSNSKVIDVSTHIITQFEVRATFLSKTKRLGTTLVADLPGIYQPLLEKRQFKLDGKIDFRSYHCPTELLQGFYKDSRDTDNWLFRMQGSYGISHSFQFTAYYGISLSRNLFTGFKYENEYSLGGELKWRLKRRAEIYAAFNYRPTEYWDVFPDFILDIDDYLNEHHDFMSTYFGETVNIILGMKLIVGK